MTILTAAAMREKAGIVVSEQAAAQDALLAERYKGVFEIIDTVAARGEFQVITGATVAQLVELGPLLERYGYKVSEQPINEPITKGAYAIKNAEGNSNVVTVKISWSA